MTNEIIYNVTCSTDDKYVQHCGIMLCSLFENNKKYKFHIHILTNGIDYTNKLELVKLVESYNSICSFYIIDESKLEGVQFRNKEPLTKAAYYRLLLGSILDQNISKVLYLDCDVIVVNEIVSLYELQLNNYALAAVQDIKGLPCSELHMIQLGLSCDGKYFNSGVMMINLDYWRKNNVEPQLIEFAKKKRIVFFHDQDVLNYLFKDHWYCISPKWNYLCTVFLNTISFNNRFEKFECLSTPHIIHYASGRDYKPWNKIYLLPKAREYRKYKKKTIWKNIPLKKVSKNKINIYTNLIDMNIFNCMYKSPFILWEIYKISRDIVKYLVCCFTNKKYYRS